MFINIRKQSLYSRELTCILLNRVNAEIYWFTNINQILFLFTQKLVAFGNIFN